MKYLIFDNINDCLARIEKCNEVLKPTWVDGITNNYCLPFKHDTLNLWALIIEDEKLFTEQELSQAQELSEDWYKKFDENEI